MTTDSPKGPETSLRERIESAIVWARHDYDHNENLVIPREAAANAAWSEIAPEVERLTAEVERLTLSEADANAYLGRAVMRAENAEAEVSRLREQLATAVVLPQDAEDRVRSAAMDGDRWTSMRADEIQALIRLTLNQVRSWSAPVSESVPATPRQDEGRPSGSGAAAPRSDGDEVRALLIHPAAWNGLVKWLDSRSIYVQAAGELEGIPCWHMGVRDLSLANAGIRDQCDWWWDDSRCPDWAERGGDLCKLHRSERERYDAETERICAAKEQDAAQAARSEATPEVPSSSPPSGGDSDTTPRVWKDVRGCEWEEAAKRGYLQLIRTDPSHRREINGLVLTRSYVETHYGPLAEVLSCSEQEEK